MADYPDINNSCLFNDSIHIVMTRSKISKQILESTSEETKQEVSNYAKSIVMTKENWIGWLQKRIPTLKDKANEFWLSQALDGYKEDTSTCLPTDQERKHCDFCFDENCKGVPNNLASQSHDSDAASFLEWVLGNDFDPSEAWAGQWFFCHKGENTQALTSQDLYKEYKQSKEK